jgi:nucleoside-diphosphate-sugar epimerase
VDEALKMKKIFITGGAGYVGSALSDYLVTKNYEVTVYDLFLYGEHVFKNDKKIKLIKGDIRNEKLLKQSLKNHDIVIHLACISNDPSFELNRSLGKSINLDAFEPLVQASLDNGIKRFIYASSSSVYGIKSELNVREDMTLEPLTDYSKFKADCEKILNKYKSQCFETVIIRPATVCGYSLRQRLDVIVNIFSNLAFHKREISIFGGTQLRPNIHINDMVRAYEILIEAKSDSVNGQIFNAGWENKTVAEIADTVKKNTGNDVKIFKIKTNDNRSYHICSEKIKKILNFETKFTISDAVNDLKFAFENKRFKDSLNNDLYFNIKRMNKLNIK